MCTFLLSLGGYLRITDWASWYNMGIENKSNVEYFFELCLFLLQKAIDTLNPKELRQLLNYRSTDKSSLSSLRARSYDLLKTNYLSTKSRLQNILEKQKYVSVFHHLDDQYDNDNETKSSFLDY